MNRLARQATAASTDPPSSSSSITSDPPPSSSSSASSSESSTISSSSIITSLPPSSSLTAPPTSLDSTFPPQSSDTSNLSSFSNTTSFPTSSRPDFNAPIPSSSPTENITTIVTTVGDRVSTYITHLPTSLVDSQPGISNSRRTAVIAGTTSAVLVLLCLSLAVVFAYRKHKLRHTIALTGKKKEGKGLLDGEDFDDDDVVVPMSSYRDRTPIPRMMSPAPSLLKSRTSETGSIFREEVWPPPGFIDPIEKHSSQVDLSKIVDDVMGPYASGSRLASDHERLGSGSTGHQGMPSTSHERDFTASSGLSHSQFSSMSSHSTTPLLSQLSQAASRPITPIPTSTTSPTTNYTDPFRSPTSPTSEFSPQSSTLPPGASAPITPGSTLNALLTMPTNVHHSSSKQSAADHSAPTGSSKANSQPKRSSPLARVLTGDTKIWLGRNLHRSPGDSG